MNGKRFSGFTAAILVLPALLLPVMAGPPPATCTAAAGNGCDLTSDLIVFGEGLPSREIVGKITYCYACSPEDGSGNFQLSANTECDQGLDTVDLETFSSWFRLGSGSGADDTYIPTNGAEVFIPSQNDLLRTRCVDPANLDYRIYELHLSGNTGAETPNLASYTHSRLRLPNSVRSTDGRFVGLDSHPVSQDLSFSHQVQYDETSPFRYWPDGMPFRIGAWVVTYYEDRVEMSAPTWAAFTRTRS